MEAKEINITHFKLVEVLPSVDEKLYVTFVMTSKMELNGKHLFDKIENQILINNEFYTYQATNDGLVLQNIDEKKATELIEEPDKKICDQNGEFQLENKLKLCKFFRPEIFSVLKILLKFGINFLQNKLRFIELSIKTFLLKTRHLLPWNMLQAQLALKVQVINESQMEFSAFYLVCSILF